MAGFGVGVFFGFLSRCCGGDGSGDSGACFGAAALLPAGAAFLAAAAAFLAAAAAAAAAASASAAASAGDFLFRRLRPCTPAAGGMTSVTAAASAAAPAAGAAGAAGVAAAGLPVLQLAQALRCASSRLRNFSFIARLRRHKSSSMINLNRQ